MKKTSLKILTLLILMFNFSLIYSQEPEKTVKETYKKIYFILEDKNGLYQIGMMDINGENKKILTNKGNNWCPAVSPDGNKVTFYSDRSNYVNLFIMNTNGSQQTQITFDKENINKIDLKNRGQISWNSDAEEIYFLRNNNICKIDKNGNSQSYITKTNDVTSFKLSPDGKKWLFSREKTKFHNSLWTMNYDTSGLIQLTESNIFNPVFDWGLNNKIVFLENRGISRINYDGTNYQIILNINNLNNEITWSKFDNNRAENNLIAYIYNDYNIYIMNENGKNIKQITKNFGEFPFWLDSQTLLFVENNDIFVININNLKKHRLTYYFNAYYPIIAEITNINELNESRNNNE
ncbi:MAG: PD40 domain-containing protein [Candidatus Goldbacteria bacterium]|nr:PD40 domain-containing protein [Candidatus Goldiibacteriota bacterium]